MAEQVTVNHWVVGSSPTLGAMPKYTPHYNDYCVDCNVNTLTIHEYYMVYDSVWEDSGLNKFDGMLCISCLEQRIGRRLQPDDFSNFPVNNPLLYPKSNRLLSRIVK